MAATLPFSAPKPVASRGPREVGRVLGFVLAIGTIVWVVAAAIADRDLVAGAEIWSVALMLVSLGVWAPSFAMPNVFSILGSLVAFVGASLLTVLVLRHVVTATELANAATYKEISVALIGAGVALIGLAIAISKRGSMLLGVIVVIAGLAWGIYGIVDYGTTIEHQVSIIPAGALFLTSLALMWPWLMNVFSGRSD